MANRAAANTVVTVAASVANTAATAVVTVAAVVVATAVAVVATVAAVAVAAISAEVKATAEALAKAKRNGGANRRPRSFAAPCLKSPASSEAAA